MALRCIVLISALFIGTTLSATLSDSNVLSGSTKARNVLSGSAKEGSTQKSRAQNRMVMLRNNAISYQQASMKIHANLQALAAKATKYGMKLPWANIDADGGMEYEQGNKRDDMSDPKLFSVEEYQHTDARDDADVAEDEPYQDDRLNHGDDSELRDNDDDSNERD